MEYHHLGLSKMDNKIYRKIIGRMEEGKIPVYPGIIRKKAIVRYKAEKEAELKRKQKEYEAKIEEERRRRAKAERRRQKKWGDQQEVVKKARAGGWIRINPDGSVSGAGEAAFSPSQAKAMGYKWGTTTRKNGKTVFVPLPKAPTEAEYLGILEWKVREGHYKRPEVERQIKQEIELGGKKYGITAPAWAGGYLKQYSAAAREIRGAYQKAVESQKTPSGYELREITLGKKGLRFGYVSKSPLRKPPIEPILPPTKKIPDKQIIPKSGEPKYKEVPKGFVRPTPYAPKFGVVEGIPSVKRVTPKPSLLPSPITIPLTSGQVAVSNIIIGGIEKIKDVVTKGKEVGISGVKGWEKHIGPIIEAPLTRTYYDPPPHIKEQWHRKMPKEELVKLYEPYKKKESILDTWKIAGKKYTELVSVPVHTLIGGKKQRDIVGQEKAVSEAYKVSEGLIKPEWKSSGEIILPVKLIPEAEEWMGKSLPTYVTPQTEGAIVKLRKEGYFVPTTYDIEVFEEKHGKILPKSVTPTTKKAKESLRAEGFFVPEYKITDKAGEWQKAKQLHEEEGKKRGYYDAERLSGMEYKEYQIWQSEYDNIIGIGKKRKYFETGFPMVLTEKSKIPILELERITGISKEQQEQWEGGAKKYLTPKGFFKEEYFEYTPAAQEYVDAYKTFKVQQEKLETIPKPHPIRQFGMGAGTLIAGLPGFVAFEAPRIAAETVIKPTASPGKAAIFGVGMYEFAKAKPVEFTGSLVAMWGLGGFKTPYGRGKIAQVKLSKGDLPSGAKAYSLGISTKRGETFFGKKPYQEFYPGVTFTRGLPKIRTREPLEFGKPTTIEAQTITGFAKTHDGYIAGSKGIYYQMPKGTVRIGADHDIYFVGKTLEQTRVMAKELQSQLGKNYEVRFSKGGNPQIFNRITGKQVVDMLRRKVGQDKVVIKDGIPLRDYKQILRDKRQIVKHVSKTDPKYAKAITDIAKTEKAVAKGEFVIRESRGGISLKRYPIKSFEQLFGIKKGKWLPESPFETKTVSRISGIEKPIIVEARGTRYFTISSKVVAKEVKSGIIEILKREGVPNVNKVADAIIKDLKKNNAELYGSLIQQQAGKAIGEPGLGRIARDIDVHVTDIEVFAKAVTASINKAAGKRVVELKVGADGHFTPTIIKSRQKLFDIHSKETPGYAYGEEFLGWGLSAEKMVKTKEGIKGITLSEQASRKFRGAVQVRSEPFYIIEGISPKTGALEIMLKPVRLVGEDLKIGSKVKEGTIIREAGRLLPEHGGRFKDIADYYFAEKSNIAGLKLRGKLISAKRADAHLEKWADAWGKEIAKRTRDAYKEALKEGEPVFLGEFGQKPIIKGKLDPHSIVSSSLKIHETSVSPSMGLSGDISSLSIIPGYKSPYKSPYKAPSSTISSIISVSGISSLSRIPPYKSPSKKISPSKLPSKKISPYVSPSKSPSPYVSPSKSPSPYVSPSKSPSPYVSPSKSPSPYVSPSKSPSPYVSPYVSPYMSPYIIPSKALPFKPFFIPKKKEKLKRKKKLFRAYQLDVTNPILSPVELLRMMGGSK